MIFNYGVYCVLCFVDAPGSLLLLGIYSLPHFHILVREHHYPNVCMNDLVICEIMTARGEVNLQQKPAVDPLNTKWVCWGDHGSPALTAESGCLRA